MWGGWGCSSLFVLLTSVVLGVAIVSMAGVGVEIHDCNVSCDGVGVCVGGGGGGGVPLCLFYLHLLYLVLL